MKILRIRLWTLVTFLILPATLFAQGLEDPIPKSIHRGGPPIRLEILTLGLAAPNQGTWAPGDNQRLFVTDQVGLLWAIDRSTGDRSVFLDLSGRLVPLGVAGPGTFDERGLLGVAFHPGYAENGLLYTYTSEPVGPAADFSTLPPGTVANHQSLIIEWHVPNPSDPGSVVDPTSARVLLRIDQPQFNHDGGDLHFGPDGLLYIALGDGGRADDQGVGHGESGNGQDLGNVMGTILRIDPDGGNSANGRYGIPPDNPFVGQPGRVEEIYLYGLRNPFRFSFDRLTGEMYIADVGQNDLEEIDIGRSGGNYGWNLKEGSFFFDPNGDDSGFVTDVDPGVPPGLIDPIAEYDHDEGRAVIGGYVYRGRHVPSLTGRYIFGDFTRIAGENAGRLFHMKKKTGGRERASQIFEFQLTGRESLGLSPLGFGEDAHGEVYVLANQTGVPFGNTGVVLRIVGGNE